MIEVEGLTKYYGEHAAIRDLSFTINKGEVIGFLGLNGAGKSTTLRVLGAVLLPTTGRVTIDGLDLGASPHEVRKRIGFLPDVPPLYNEMTVGDYLAFVAQLRGVPAESVAARVSEAEQKTALAEVHDDVIGTLSHGFRQRVGVAQALVHKPALLILDEPTSGLDPNQIREMRNLIRALKGEHTVLLSSHILTEVSQTCDRLLIIDEGKLVAQGTEAELSRGSGAAVEIEVAGGADKAKAALVAVEGVRGVEVIGPTQLRVQAAPEVRPALVRALVGANVDVLRIDRAASQLESIFTELTA
ncbi:MAG TPA: ABC transporter ATP-binding protein [Polyangia bacterium]|nr:ABC transporter ATP-binding protein [Polyangia bacterium]